MLILGIGNTLLTDEGMGVHVVHELSRQYAGQSDVECMDGGTISFMLSGPIVSTQNLIIVDTAALDAPPGTIRVFEGPAMDDFVAHGGKSSVHEVSVADLLSIAALEGLLPARRALVGIQPENFDWGDYPTPAVARAIPAACEAVDNILRRWQL
ncbi:HyaD/HybD family hydrogenase maturation endopeptidase [Thioalkalivibrio sp.]|uniref:HyaD/HybD family hydrogenase maturation endopeptidase n=3 Tax=Thioalkalivibrio sp. TaxID=2093813 RepID=UPI0035657B05